MKLTKIALLALLLSACQPASDDSAKTEPDAQSTAKTEAKQEAQTHDHEGHSHVEQAAQATSDNGLPYDIVESDESCSEPVVIEFFAYQCPHCYTLEEHAKKWKDKNAGKVKFVAIPTHLGNQQFGAFLIVHQAAEVLGILDKAMPKMFSRLHEEQKAFGSEDEAADFLATLGVSKDEALTALQDQENAKNALDDNFRLLAKYKIAGVPTILVNHRYKFDVTKAGGYDKVFEVVDQTLAMPSNCSGQ